MWMKVQSIYDLIMTAVGSLVHIISCLYPVHKKFLKSFKWINCIVFKIFVTLGSKADKIFPNSNLESYLVTHSSIKLPTQLFLLYLAKNLSGSTFTQIITRLWYRVAKNICSESFQVSFPNSEIVENPTGWPRAVSKLHNLDWV